FVDDAHSAASDLAKDAVFAELLEAQGRARARATTIRLARDGWRPWIRREDPRHGRRLLQVLEEDERWEHIANFRGSFRTPADVFLDAGVLAAAPAREEVLGEKLHRLTASRDAPFVTHAHGGSDTPCS